MRDDGNARDPRPHFELITFDTPTGVPHGWDEELLKKGIPSALFGAYQAVSRLTVLEIPGYGPLVCFGTCGRSCSMCLNPHTGEVVGGVITLPNVRPRLVNSSLDQFITSVRAVLARFPFDQGGTERNKWEASGFDDIEAEWNQAADELTETLRNIDPAAVTDLDGFWMMFVADVQMGNLATEDFLGDTDE